MTEPTPRIDVSDVVTAKEPLELVERLRHDPQEDDPTICYDCGQPWPCDSIQAAQTIEGLRAENERLASKWRREAEDEDKREAFVLARCARELRSLSTNKHQEGD